MKRKEKKAETARMHIGFAGPNQFESITEEDDDDEKEWCL